MIATLAPRMPVQPELAYLRQSYAMMATPVQPMLAWVEPVNTRPLFVMTEIFALLICVLVEVVKAHR